MARKPFDTMRPPSKSDKPEDRFDTMASEVPDEAEQQREQPEPEQRSSDDGREP